MWSSAAQSSVSAGMGGAVSRTVLLGLVLALPGGLSADAAESPAPPGPSPAAMSDSGAAAGFLERARQRILLDEYAAEFNRVEEEIKPGVSPPEARFRPSPRAVRVVRAELPASVLKQRLAVAEPVHPLPGFRAPILDRATEPCQVTLAEAELTTEQRQAAETIHGSLARDGLLVTLAHSLEILGPERFTTNGAAGVLELRKLGFPVDLLKFFQLGPGPSGGPADLIRLVAQQLNQGNPTDAIAPVLCSARFVFTKTHCDFKGAAETGQVDIGLLRVQIGGGYRGGVDEAGHEWGGIVSGGSIDVTGQLVAALPEVDMWASVPEAQLQNMRWLALNCWPLRRANHVTFIAERLPVSAWAQDNGKAGYLAVPGRDWGALATLAPRYASQAEIDLKFFPGESFLMDGLRAAGHTVLHSPLLFQGGNLLVAHDPGCGEQVLLLSEAEIYRNTTLGLTRSQVLESFRVEFGVDRCVPVPVVSFHLDYDLTMRVHKGQVIAFVNDTAAAARLILLRAATALEQHNVLSPDAAKSVREGLEQNNPGPVIEQFRAALKPFRNEHHQYQTRLVGLFAAGPGDAPVFNFQCFMAALDLLAGLALNRSGIQVDDRSIDYFSALNDLAAAAQTQQETLRKQGWSVVPVPSMPDLYCGLNYLNGLQDRRAYLMPALGGFYKSLDQAAAQAFQAVLGDEINIIHVLSQGIQAQHGGLHCVASAYPRLERGPDTDTSFISPPDPQRTARARLAADR